MGRWINRDPIWEIGGINLYAFVHNNNVNLLDNLGLTTATPAPFPVPIFLPPIVIPGTPENDQWVEDVNRLINAIKESLKTEVQEEAKVDEATEDRNSKTLFHYTNLQGYIGINAEKEIKPSIGFTNARFGNGQYFTDIPPEVIIYRKKGELTEGELIKGYKSVWQVSYSLYGMPWNTSKLKYYFEIDVSGLPINNPAPYIYLHKSECPLDVSDRIIRHGRTFWD